ncbi:hypothetical protein L596_028823 [Steinernema carpocapsae]|uniref:Uncharacterized protein n=1 Tax=Steinernema carpocapsae TaxID=34508 RepID=A0A4V5ZY09_STECR|nr:hypothetical protein L596_028823 [Steinernema carpocapsae]
MWTKTKGTAHVYKKAIEQTPLNVSFVSVDEGTTRPNGSFSRGFSQESMLRISIALQSTGAVVGFVVELKLFANSVDNKVERSHVPMKSMTFIHESWNFDS